MAKIFSLDESPIINGGISEKHLIEAINTGWKKGEVTEDYPSVDIVFKDDTNPIGLSIRPTFVPKGTKFIWHPDGRAVVAACGNPTCWRWMVPTAMELPEVADW